jgi:hypothetical protein
MSIPNPRSLRPACAKLPSTEAARQHVPLMRSLLASQCKQTPAADHKHASLLACQPALSAGRLERAASRSVIRVQGEGAAHQDACTRQSQHRSSHQASSGPRQHTGATFGLQGIITLLIGAGCRVPSLPNGTFVCAAWWLSTMNWCYWTCLIAVAAQAVLLDQFGVLHDGQRPYLDAIAAVQALADRGLKLLILSNSSRSAPLHLHVKQSHVCGS